MPWFGLECGWAVCGHSPHAGTRQALDGSRVTGLVCLAIKLSNELFPSWLRNLSKISVPFSTQRVFYNSALPSQALWSLLFLEVEGTNWAPLGLWQTRAASTALTCGHCCGRRKDFLTSTQTLMRTCSTGLAQLGAELAPTAFPWLVKSLQEWLWCCFSWRRTSGPSENVTVLSPFPKANSYCQNQLFQRAGLCKQQDALETFSLLWCGDHTGVQLLPAAQLWVPQKICTLRALVAFLQ